jgi:hypothetical protein
LGIKGFKFGGAAHEFASYPAREGIIPGELAVNMINDLIAHLPEDS